MLEVILICVTYAWTASTGPVDHYVVYVDGEMYATALPVTEPTAEVCTYGEDPHTVTVQAFSATGDASIKSGPSEPYAFPLPEPRVPLPPYVRADLDGDGVVGFTDFGLFGQFFGICHDDMEVVPCP